jgi:hypothetical protein
MKHLYSKKELNCVKRHLPERVKIECQLYADDSKLTGIIEKNEDEMQKDINSMHVWIFWYVVFMKLFLHTAETILVY